MNARLNRHGRRELAVRCRRGIASQAEVQLAASMEQSEFPWIEWQLVLDELRRQPRTEHSRRKARRLA